MIDPWYLTHLVCPRDYGQLSVSADELACPAGHRYSVVDGMPVMLLDDVQQTMNVAEASLTRARLGAGTDERAGNWFLESLGISDEEKAGIRELARSGGSVDPVVAYLVAATNGLMYRHLIGDLAGYPIPELPLQSGNGRRLLDVGCSWGRWSIAASLRGYDVVGIDPSLGAVMAARRVAHQLGASNRYVVGDARFLPFPPASVDQVYSYSVIQHLSPADATRSVAEMGRVLKPGGSAKIQMPTRFGVRCLYHQSRRRFREAVGFEVRYWTLARLRSLFTGGVGQTKFEVDCYFGIGLQRADEHLMTPTLRFVLRLSESLKAASRYIPGLLFVADSVFADASKPTTP